MAPGTTLPSAPTQKTPFPGGEPITSADLTSTLAFPREPPPYDPSLTREEYARFAWRQFIHLNSPAAPKDTPQRPADGISPVLRGKIDPNRNFAASGDPLFFQKGTGINALSGNALVWETFAHRSELFPKDTPLQGDLSLLNPRYIFANVTVDPQAKSGPKPLADAKLIRFNNLDENSQIDQNQIFFPRNGSTPSKTNPYDDHMILFEAKVNHVEYDYIRETLKAAKAAESANTTAPNRNDLPQHIEFPPNVGNTKLPSTTRSQEESVEVKAAWREMTPELINSGRYHTAEAIFYVKGANGIEPRVATFGLVGLHILRKTENYPTFIYTTFEHVDSLQKPDNSPTGLYVVTLYDTMRYRLLKGAPPITSNPQAMVNTGDGHFQAFPLPLEGPVTAANRYPIVPDSFHFPAGLAGPIKVGVSHAMTKRIEVVNQEVLAAMDSTPAFNNSVWKYYRLAGIQIRPVDETNPTVLSEDFYLANNVIESSQPGIQLFKGAVSDPGTRGAAPNQLINERSQPNILQVRGLEEANNKVVMGGCMGCHGNAQYPRDPNNHGIGPTIFNFLTNEDTLSGKGFEVDVRPVRIEEPRTSTRAYIQ